MPFEEGPYVQLACFCDMVIRDDTGVLSLIRVIDRITSVVRGPNPPEDMPPALHQLKLVLGFKSGRAQGRHAVRIVPRRPDGSSANPIDLTVHFEGDERGVNRIVDLHFTFTQEGLYWFDVRIDDELITALPLRIIYNRQVIGTSS